MAHQIPGIPFWLFQVTTKGKKGKILLLIRPKERRRGGFEIKVNQTYQTTAEIRAQGGI